jgi:hypothetical protein
MSTIRSGTTKTTLLSIESDNSDSIIFASSQSNGITLTNETVQIEKELIIPTGSMLQRPAYPILGEIRFNTSINTIEGYDGNNWVTIQV